MGGKKTTQGVLPIFKNFYTYRIFQKCFFTLIYTAVGIYGCTCSSA